MGGACDGALGWGFALITKLSKLSTGRELGNPDRLLDCTAKGFMPAGAGRTGGGARGGTRLSRSWVASGCNRLANTWQQNFFSCSHHLFSYIGTLQSMQVCSWCSMYVVQRPEFGSTFAFAELLMS